MDSDEVLDCAAPSAVVLSRWSADSTVVVDDTCCWREAAFSDFRFSQIFSFGGGAGTNLTGGVDAGFSADGFFDGTFLVEDSTASWSWLSSTSLETDLDTEHIANIQLISHYADFFQYS